MGWGALIGAAIGAAGSYYGASQQSDAIERASRGAGDVGLTTTRYPWEASSPYRSHLLDMAFNQLLAGQGGGGGPRMERWTPSGATTGTIDWLQGALQGGSPYSAGAEGYWGNLLSGEDAQNPYRQAAGGLFGDEVAAYGGAAGDLGRFADMLFSGQMPGTAGGGGTGGWGGGWGGFAGAGAGSTPNIDFGAGPVGAAGYIQDILGGQYLEGNPFLDEVIGGARRDIEESTQRGLLGRLGDLAGGGLYGGGWTSQAYEDAAAEMGQRIGDVEHQFRAADYNARMGDLMQALGYGTQLDIAEGNALADLAAAETGARAASASAGANYRLGMEGIASEERLARMGALLDALGMQQGGRQFALTGMGGLGGQLGGEQLGAFSLMPSLANLDIERGLGAFGPAFALDQLLREDVAGRNAGARNRWQRQQDQPWINLGRFADLINAADPGYGETVEWGFDRRAQSPGIGPNPWLQGLGGAMAGWQFGGQWGQNRGGGSGSPGITEPIDSGSWAGYWG